MSASTSAAAGQPARVFISYRSEEPELALGRRLHDALQAAGHLPFLAEKSIGWGDDWRQRIEEELPLCDYFVVLLSPGTAASEMVTEEVRRAKLLRDSRGGKRPVILPVRMNLPWDATLSFDLAGYLGGIQQRRWDSGGDTPAVVAALLALLAAGAVVTPAGFEGGAWGDLGPALPAPAPDQRPLPAAAPELPEGRVRLTSPFYVERPPIESRCYEEIEQPGALLRIKAPRQMGKTSLMARTLRHAADLGYRTTALSFQLADGSIFSDLDALLRWFCGAITWQLKLPDRLADSWSVPGSKLRSTDYFERHLLAEVEQPLVLALDEVDLVFGDFGVASDFLGMLRTWHEDAKDLEIWQKLRLVVVHSTEAYIPLKIHESPFNVGLPIALPEFDRGQVADLAGRHGLGWQGAEVEELMGLVGGHPFLVRLGLYHVARGEVSLAEVLASGPTEAGLYGDHLRRHLWNLEQFPELARAVREAASGNGPVRLPSEQAFKLESMGLVRRSGNDVTLRYALYERYFRDRLRASR